MAADATRPTRHRFTVRFIGYSSILLRKPTSTPVFHHRVWRMSDSDGYSASSGYHYFSENSGEPIERKTVKTDTFGAIEKSCRYCPVRHPVRRHAFFERRMESTARISEDRRSRLAGSAGRRFLVPKLQLGNAGLRSSASRITVTTPRLSRSVVRTNVRPICHRKPIDNREAELRRRAFPSRSLGTR